MPRGVLGRVLSLLDVAVIGSILTSSFVFAYVLSALDLHRSLLVLGFGFPLVAVLGIGPMLRADRQSVAALKALEPKIALLQVLDLFSAAARPVVERLARSLDEVQVPTNTFVIREGEEPDALWIIVDGEVEVTIGGRFVRTMGPRSYFGEIGILRGVPRTATVRTTEPSVLWRISADDFKAALSSGAASASMLTLASSRLARSHPRLAASAEVEPELAATPG
jgi:hypothetical protein